MKDDPIVKEVREARKTVYESYDCDIHKMFDDMMQRQWKSGHNVVNLSKEQRNRSATHPITK